MRKIDRNIKKTLENLEKSVLNIDWSEFIKNNFVVRVKRFNSDIDTVKYERNIGGYILDNTPNIKVKLVGSDSYIRVVVFEDTVFLSTLDVSTMEAPINQHTNTFALNFLSKNLSPSPSITNTLV